MHTGGGGFGSQPLASVLLANAVWTSRATSSIMATSSTRSCGGSERVLADKLTLLVAARLASHKSSRIADVDKRSHYSLDWFEANISRLSAIAVMYKLCDEDLACATSESSLFSHPEPGSGSFRRVDRVLERKLEGCYLYFDPKLGVIRSGELLCARAIKPFRIHLILDLVRRQGRRARSRIGGAPRRAQEGGVACDCLVSEVPVLHHVPSQR